MALGPQQSLFEFVSDRTNRFAIRSESGWASRNSSKRSQCLLSDIQRGFNDSIAFVVHIAVSNVELSIGRSVVAGEYLGRIRQTTTFVIVVRVVRFLVALPASLIRVIEGFHHEGVRFHRRRTIDLSVRWSEAQPGLRKFIARLWILNEAQRQPFVVQKVLAFTQKLAPAMMGDLIGYRIDPVVRIVRAAKDFVVSNADFPPDRTGIYTVRFEQAFR